MGLYEDLRQFSEQVKKRQGFIKGEESTKQALVLPFLQILGFDIYDPTEIRPEYVADFAKKKSNGQFEKIDYALYVKGELGIFVECKSIEAKLQDHDGQLALLPPVHQIPEAPDPAQPVRNRWPHPEPLTAAATSRPWEAYQ